MENQKEEIITSLEEANDKKPSFLDKPEEDWTTDDAKEAKEYAQTLYGQKEHWKHKANKKDEIKEDPNKKSEEINNNNNGNADVSWQEKMELKVEGYSDEEISFIQQNGGKKALENPIVKQAIENIREKSKAEQAVIEDDSKSEIEKKYSSDQLKDMPLDEIEKLLPKAN